MGAFFGHTGRAHQFPGRAPKAAFWLLLFIASACAPSDKAPETRQPGVEESALLAFFRGQEALPPREDVERRRTKLRQPDALYLAHTAAHLIRSRQYDSAQVVLHLLSAQAPFFPAVPIEAEVAKNLGAIAYYREDYPTAIDQMLKGLEVYERAGDSLGMASSLNNVGNVYYAMQDFDQAMSFFRQSFDLRALLGDSIGMARALHNISNALADKGDFEAANTYGLNALKLKERLQPDQYASLANSYNNIALNYKNLERLNEAEAYALKSLNYYALAQDPSGMAYSQNTLAIIYLEKKQYAPARQYALQTLTLADSIPSLLLRQRANLVLANIYQAQGRSNDAFQYLKQSLELKDSLLNEEKNRAVLELQQKYETEKKEREIQLLQKDKEIQAEKARKDRRLRLALISFISMLCLLLLGIGSLYRQKNKANQLLNQSNAALSELNALKDRLFATLSHDLKGPVAAFQSIATALKANLNRLDHSQMEDFLRSMQLSANGIAHTLHNLLHWAKLQKGLHSALMEEVQFSAVLDNVLTQLGASLEEKRISVETHFDTRVPLYTDAGILEIALRNLLSNAIRHSPPASIITLRCQQDDAGATLEVEDQGPGIPTELQQVLFDPIARRQLDRQMGNKGSGIGLILVKEALASLGGDISVRCPPGKGAVFSLFLPRPSQKP